MSNRRGSGVRDRDWRLEAFGVNDIGARCTVPRRCCFRCSVARRRRIKIKILETALEVSLAIETDTRYFKSDPLGNHVVQGDVPPNSMAGVPATTRNVVVKCQSTDILDRKIRPIM